MEKVRLPSFFLRLRPEPRPRDPCPELRPRRNAFLQTESTAGTTAVLCCARGPALWVAHVGGERAEPSSRHLPHSRVFLLLADSRAILGSYDGSTYTSLTTDHKPDDCIERDRIERAGGVVIIDRYSSIDLVDSRVGLASTWTTLNMSRALGDCWSRNPETEEFVVSSTPDVRMHSVSLSDDFAVLCSDGVSFVLTDQDIVEFVARELRRQTPARKSRRSNGSTGLQETADTLKLRTGDKAHRAAERLCDLALARWASKYPASNADNISAVVLVFRPYAAAAEPERSPARKRARPSAAD